MNLKYKGQIDVIKALYLLKTRDNIIYNYQLVGAGNAENLKKIIRRYNLEKQVQIIGMLPHEQMASWYKNIDIYIHPSYTEGLSRAIIEAMNFGKPVLCSNAGGNIELIDRNFIFKKGNYKQIYYMLKGLNTQKLNNESIRNFEYIIKNFDKDKLESKRNNFYQEFIKED